MTISTTSNHIKKSLRRANTKSNDNPIIKNEADLENLYRLWPSEADPDDLLEFIQKDRKERRKNLKRSKV